MKLIEALTPVIPLSETCIVVTTMASGGEWPASADNSTVFHYLPSSMGQGPSLGLGLALAQPNRRVIVINGDGCMLMNFGSLVTLGKVQPPNLALLVIDNGIYEVTGGQPHAGSGSVDYCGVAKSCGFPAVHGFTEAGDWSNAAAGILAKAGLVFVRLIVEPRFGQETPKPRRPMSEQIARLRRALSD